MPRFHPIAALLAVTVVAACGQDRAPEPAPPTTTATSPADPAATLGEVDDEELVRLVFQAAADRDPAALPDRVTARVSLARVAAVALHDQLLERRSPTPDLAALLGALDTLATTQGAVDAPAVPALVGAWRTWTPEQRATEAELARHLSLASAALALPSLPRADGLRDIAAKAAGAGAAPPMSPAGAGIAFVRYAALALGDPGNEATPQQTDALREARAAFDALGWPGGLGVLAENIAELMLQADPTSLRAIVLWSAADDAFRASGDLLRSGQMHVDRARGVWRGQADAAAVRRAALLAETGRRRVEQSGAAGRELFEACSVHAIALQAAGRHGDAVAAADAALAVDGVGSPAERSDLQRVRAVSLFRLGRFEDCRAACEQALAGLGPDFAPAADAEHVLVPELEELQAHACLELGRFEDAVRLLEAVAAFHERDAGKPWASAERRVEALLLRARALARSGDRDGARAEVRALLTAGGQGTTSLAFAADVLLEAGFVDDAEDVVTQAQQALGPAHAGLFGELAGRVAAARGDLEAARGAFRGAVDYVTGGDSTRKSLAASRIFESWARVEEAAGHGDRARELFQTAANHLVDIGVDLELQRLLKEVERLQ